MLKERVFEKIKEIEENLALISDNLPDNAREFRELKLVKDGIYKRLEYCIENLIDICSMIYADLELGVPSDDEDILNKLKDNKIFSKEIINLIKDMKGLRNILVHKYGNIDDDLVYELLAENLSDFDKIIKEITGYFNKEK
ncbi:DUF86 domain-containing protein [Candidatus Pacearchaeota archaeon]|nr:DUF86 domain-containing protein [Candidatus Pacearchaeota archaeon]MBD3283147.1 DUF86 domain-containing protein [Candidatus Pacearchaeota archaeon]